ncbi:MAG: hypothetical protein IIB60_03650 [Planctomycetes bacterium]|nr:hypothetical protein [Planctomycetota bacterium]
MVWLILLGLFAQFVFPMAASLLPVGLIFPIVLGLIYLGVYVCMAVCVVLLLAAQGNHVLMIIVCGILMLAPCANLLLLLLVNMSATRTLKRAGVRVGFMGAKSEDVERIVNPELCNGCGYNLTGNVSGFCTECGLTIEQNRQKVL